MTIYLVMYSWAGGEEILCAYQDPRDAADKVFHMSEDGGCVYWTKELEVL